MQNNPYHDLLIESTTGRGTRVILITMKGRTKICSPSKLAHLLSQLSCERAKT
jgi:hypothetical protein